MNLKEIYNIKSPEPFNCELDKFLKTTPVISKELVSRLYDAYSYGQATSVCWVIGKLKILKNRIDNSEVLELEGDDFLDCLKFQKWVKSVFSNIYQDIFIEHM
jgi:hypothetical protein